MNLRKAQLEDALLVLEWRNDETSRKNSFNQEVISQETHLNWFKKKLSDESCLFYILEDEEGPAGCIRLDVTKDIGEISSMIEPSRRGKGYGTIIMSLMEKEAKKAGLKTLVGFVSSSNPASAKCCENNDYVKLVAGDIDLYIKNI